MPCILFVFIFTSYMRKEIVDLVACIQRNIEAHNVPFPLPFKIMNTLHKNISKIQCFLQTIWFNDLH